MHGIMTSALWAVARTPALVEAIESVDATYDEVSQLSLILTKLRCADDLREAAQAADAFLRASHVTFYDSMEPMEAIRAIVGLCTDSDKVLEQALCTTYRWVRYSAVFLPHARFSRSPSGVLSLELCCVNV